MFTSCLLSTSRRAGPALLAAFLACLPVAGWSADSAPVGTDALARFLERRGHALTIGQELKQRIAQLEQQDKDATANSAELQQQLGRLLKGQQSADDTIRRLQAEIASNQTLIDAARSDVAKLQEERRVIEKQIEDEKGKQWLCNLPFSTIYCLADKLIDRHRGLDAQLRSIGDRLQAVEGQRNEARAKLAGLEDARRVTDAERTRTHAEIAASEQQLKALHKKLASNRVAYQRHREVLDNFSQELQQIEQHPPSERPGAIGHRLTRLDARLANEMTQACLLIVSGGRPLSRPLRQACPVT